MDFFSQDEFVYRCNVKNNGGWPYFLGSWMQMT